MESFDNISHFVDQWRGFDENFMEFVSTLWSCISSQSNDLDKITSFHKFHMHL